MLGQACNSSLAIKAAIFAALVAGDSTCRAKHPHGSAVTLRKSRLHFFSAILAALLVRDS
jgi:hypothetical protein